ncbi:MAG: mycothiol conjugate amidase Mca [Actinobacteria bacterium]|nr:mycothiol conjugate amidase Mca [Actinomycetota bacterium]
MPRSGLRLLAVHAHPDDESSKGAATIARYAAEGVQVLVAVCTDGSRGEILNPAADKPELSRDLAAARRREIARACQILGVDHEFLGFTDSGFPDSGRYTLPDGCFARQPVSVAVEPLVRIIRQLRPHVMLAYDESGGYPHPDHIMSHKISIAAFEAAAAADRYPAAGDPWQAAKLYYHASFNRPRFRALHAEMNRRSSSDGGMRWRESWGEAHESFPWQDLPVTTRIHCSDYFEKREMALLAHTTQVDPNGFWLAYPADVQRTAWPTEDFFLARSVVDTVLPEDDLFAGIPAVSSVAAHG